MKKWIGLVMATALIAVSGVAHAQFGGLASSFLGGSQKGGISAEMIVQKYVQGSKDVMTADVHLLKALGLKEQADKEALAIRNLTEGATASGLKDATKVQTESSKAIAARMQEKNIVMDEQSKQVYTTGLLHLAKGVIQYTSLLGDLKNFEPSVASIGTAGNAALYVGQSLPESSTSLLNTLKNAVTFAQQNQIEIPKEATDLL